VSELLVKVTILTVLLLFYSLLHYKSVMSGWAYFKIGWGYFRIGVGLLSRERVLENTPTTLFEQPLMVYF